MRDRTGAQNPNWRGGKTAHPLYLVYSDMLARCRRPTHPRFADYGGRGISVCQSWASDFWAYVADVGERPAPGMSIDRVDNDGNYEPGNVRWATAVEQRGNRRPVTRCAAGHELTDANTIRRACGRRRCATCARKYDREWKQARRDAAREGRRADD